MVYFMVFTRSAICICMQSLKLARLVFVVVIAIATIPNFLFNCGFRVKPNLPYFYMYVVSV